MTPNPASHPTADQRRYIRLKSVFPVEFAVVHSPEDVLDMDWQQGYTSNVGKGGLCLETVSCDEETLCRLREGKACLELRIRIPLSFPSMKATAGVTWIERPDDVSGRRLIGLKFISIAPSDLARLVGHARRLKFSAFAAAGALFLLFLMLIISGGYNYKLRSANEALVSALVATQQEETETRAAIEDVLHEGDIILRQLEQYAGGVTGRQALEETYEELVRRKNGISDRLALLARKKGGLQKTIVEKMHLWLKNHQSPSTGLISSFEGDDPAVRGWAFVYDQALAAHVFLLFGDDQGARKILNFFNRHAKGGFRGFNNAYYYDSGDVAEFTVHCGPNIWIGIAALQYTHKTGDKYYLPLARKIADWLITVQDKDPAGGLKGGPEFPWFATEHNLDAYALFGMMFRITAEEKYRLAAEKVMSWLKTYALAAGGKDYKPPPVNRGRGDATIATDTYAWALAAVGPEKLREMGMDPEAIMAFAEKHCGVEVSYERPSGLVVNVKGFDFARYAHMPRGGMISTEWTSQMVISLRLLSDYFARQGDFDKRGYYAAKADMYLDELNKLIISSPSAKGQGEGCLPYATLADADTGHGWNTPRGAGTCSMAGTAYMLMAIRQSNPLMLEENGNTGR